MFKSKGKDSVKSKDKDPKEKSDKKKDKKKGSEVDVTQPSAGAKPAEEDPDALKKLQDEEAERLKRERESKEKAEKEKKEQAARDAKKKEEEKKKKLDDKRRKEEAVRKSQSSEEAAFEVQELETYKPGQNDEAAIDPALHFPADVYLSYDKLQNFARDLNTQIQLPEIVIIGAQGSGKSSVLESILGQPLNIVGYRGATRRPIIFNLNNNVDCEEPRIILKRDSIQQLNIEHDTPIQKVSQLPEHLRKRNVASDAPIIVQYEHKYTFNMMFVDTPGLIDENQGDLDAEEIRKIVTHWIKPAHRLILAVEESVDVDQLKMKAFMKKIDPEFSRTVFISTKFHNQLQRFTNTREANRYLQSVTGDATTFFVSLPSSGVRDKFVEAPKFREKLWQYEKRDLNNLEKLVYDKTYEGCIGVGGLRKYLVNKTWRSYQNFIPKILKQLRHKKDATEESLKKVQQDLASLDSSRLRKIATNYVVDFLQIIERLISGTSEGNPSVNGQTLEEEKKESHDGEWYTASGAVVKFDPADEKWKVPYWNNRLYGGQQFERLLVEFKAVAEHTDFPDISLDDIATAAGIGKLNNVPDYAWAASDLAQQKSRECLQPLIEQVCSRSIYIMKRLTGIAQSIMDQRNKLCATVEGVNNRSTSSIDNIAQYSYFTFHVRDLYDKFVEDTSKIVRDKCMDEFYSTRAIYWDLTELSSKKENIPITGVDEGGDSSKMVVDLARKVFVDLVQRITQNVLLKFYNFFLVPIQTELWNVIQGDITCMGDEMLEQKFQVFATRSKLQDEESNHKDIIQDCANQEQVFMKAATQFCHPILGKGNL